MVASHVDHVICFSISDATWVFPVHQYEVQLFHCAVMINCAITLLWSLPMWIMSFDSASLMQHGCFLSTNMKSNCFTVPLSVLQVACLSSVFSVHRVECCEVLYHQPLLHPASSLVYSISRSQIDIEISSSSWNSSISIVLYIFSTWWSPYSEWEK